MEQIQVQASYKITLSSGAFWSRNLPISLDRTTPMSKLRMVLSEKTNETLRVNLGFVVIEKISDTKDKELPFNGFVRDHVKNKEVLLLEGRVLSRKEIDADALSWNCRPTASLPREVTVFDPQLVPAFVTQLVPALVPQLMAALAPQLLSALSSVSTPALARSKEAGSKEAGSEAQEEIVAVRKAAERKEAADLKGIGASKGVVTVKGAGTSKDTMAPTKIVAPKNTVAPKETAAVKETVEPKGPVVVKETLALNEIVPKSLDLGSCVLDQSTSPSPSSASSSAVSLIISSPALIQPPAQALVNNSDSDSDSDGEENQPSPIDKKERSSSPIFTLSTVRLPAPLSTSDSDSSSDSSDDEDDSSDDEDDRQMPNNSKRKAELLASSPKRPRITTVASSFSDDTDSPSSSSDSENEDAGKNGPTTSAVKGDSGVHPQDILDRFPSLVPCINAPPPPPTLTELCRRIAAENAKGSLEQALNREEGKSQGGTAVTQGSGSVPSRNRGPLELLFD
ncbi:hypothetical protein BGW39_007112 [Mortierella sp. 14UC]|nr:hypothetical protein BGW39_007112 [Mortierella sp. 14UC]